MNELNMIRVLLDEAPPSAEVIAEGRRRIAASAAEPGRPGARRSRGFRHRTARRVAIVAVAAGAAAALAFVTLVPHGAPAARPGHGQADGLPGLPAREFLLTMAVKAAATGPSTGRYYCSQMQQGQRLLVGAHDTTLQAPWDQGPAASLAGYQYALFTKTLIQSCVEPPRTGWSGGDVEDVTQSLGAQPASPADAAAWRRDGSPTSWIAWYDQTVRITAAPGRRYVSGPRRWTGEQVNYATLPTSPARLEAFFLDHQAEFHEAGTRTEILINDALTAMSAPSTPAVRAAAFRVLASLPGIRMEPGVQDPGGQSGTAVLLGRIGQTEALAVVDPATSALLCIEQVTVHPVAHTPVGTAIIYTLFVSGVWTNARPSS
jgi:hypothetical protein